MRIPFTAHEACDRGVTPAALKWGVEKGTLHRLCQGAYVEGPESPTPEEIAFGVVVAKSEVAAFEFAATLYGLDSVRLNTDRRVSRKPRDTEQIVYVSGIPTTAPMQTLFDVAAVVSDLAWEQVLESALRKRLITMDEVHAEVLRRTPQRVAGMRRVRRVLAMRPVGTVPTESLLETLMVQLVRSVGLPDPVRQHEVFSEFDTFVARLDLCWPDQGLFIELDGQHHKDQPVYDARRETAVVAKTGWLPGRFTWTEVVRTPRSTARRIVELYERASEYFFRSAGVPPRN